MAEQRTYTVPLRSGFSRTERYRRAKRAVLTLRGFLAKHMKSEEVKLTRPLNEYLWARGIRKPPARVTVVCEKDENGVVHATLEGLPLPSDASASEKAAEKPSKKAQAQEQSE